MQTISGSAGGCPLASIDADELRGEVDGTATIRPRFSACRPGSSSGLLPMTPCSLPNATIEPVKVTAPTNTPMKISTSWMRASTPRQAGWWRRRLLAKPTSTAASADEAVQDGDQLRHRRHLDPRREDGADAAAHREHAQPAARSW